MVMVYDYDTIRAEIERLLRGRESGEVEFKSAKGGFPKSFWETYSAFANTHGGLIVLGIKESESGFFPNLLTEGDVEKLLKDFWSGANNKNTISACLLKESDVQVVDIDDAKIIIFYVPQASRSQRPVYCGLNALEKTFRRGYEGDFLCTPMEVRRMFADADTERPADGRILKNFSWDDIDMPSFEQYRRLMSLARPSHPWLALSDQELMQKLGGYRRDRATAEEGFTLAGLLMFGKYEAIREPDCVPHYFPDYREIPLNPTQERWIDRIYPDGTWEANLFQFYRRVLPKLQEVLPVPFRLEQGQRQDETPAHEAIREAFANLCVHADYSEESSLLISRYPNRIVFSNPGTLLISREQYYRGGESVCRNTSLQQMFMMLGAVEKAGSGVDKILSGWKSMCWERPYPVERMRPNKVELVMPLDSFLDERGLQGLRGSNGLSADDLTAQERTILSLAISEGMLANARLREILDLHSAEVTHLLQKLTSEGFLSAHGYGKGRVYTLQAQGEKSYKLKGETLQAKRRNLTSSGGEILQAKRRNLTSSGGEILQAKRRNLTSSGGEILQAQDGQPYKPEGKTIQTDAFPRRMSSVQLLAIVLDYCQQWRSVEEVAQYISRTKQYVRGQVLPKMSDLLEMKYPRLRNHPQQMYRAKDIKK